MLVRSFTTGSEDSAQFRLLDRLRNMNGDTDYRGDTFLEAVSVLPKMTLVNAFRATLHKNI
jgi:hypothetical protein